MLERASRADPAMRAIDAASTVPNQLGAVLVLGTGPELVTRPTIVGAFRGVAS